MLVETTLRPQPPYELGLCARLASDPTRVFRNGVLTLAFEAGGAPALARVAQRPDGTLALALRSPVPDVAHDHLRFVLAVDADTRPFLRRVARDPLLGALARRRAGYRPLRLSTVSHALLRALAGQLIAAPEARRIEHRLVRRVATPIGGGLYLPPTRAQLGGLSPAQAAATGLAPRRATALVSVLRRLDVERLGHHPTPAVARRLSEEPQLGPWSTGVIALYGLGRFDHGLVGDLGLIKLCSALAGRRVEADATAALLARYGEWAGLASAHLLSHPLSGVRTGGPRPVRS